MVSVRVQAERGSGSSISMHAFARLFTSELIANECRVFDWLGALNKK